MMKSKITLKDFFETRREVISGCGLETLRICVEDIYLQNKNDNSLRNNGLEPFYEISKYTFPLELQEKIIVEDGIQYFLNYDDGDYRLDICIYLGVEKGFEKNMLDYLCREGYPMANKKEMFEMFGVEYE